MGTIISSIATAALVCCLAYLLLLLARELKGYVAQGQQHVLERQMLGARIAQVSEPLTKLASKPNEGAWAGVRKFVLEGSFVIMLGQLHTLAHLAFFPSFLQPLNHRPLRHGTLFLLILARI